MKGVLQGAKARLDRLQLFEEPRKLIHRGDSALELEMRHGGGTQNDRPRWNILGHAGLGSHSDIVADRYVIHDPDLARQRDPISDLRAA
jgi:hypothetical protein